MPGFSPGSAQASILAEPLLDQTHFRGGREAPKSAARLVQQAERGLTHKLIGRVLHSKDADPHGRLLIFRTLGR